MFIPIKQIKLHRLTMTLKNPFTTSFGTVQEKPFIIVEATDMMGNHGFGETVAFSSPWYTEETVETCYHVLKDFLIPIMQQEQIHHPDDVTTLFTPIKRHHMAKAALEGAIWDLYAKQQNIPLYRALGGTKSRINIGISIGLQESEQILLQKVQKAVNDGFKRVKLKIKPGADIDILQTIRYHFPNIDMMADANSAYTLKDIEHLQKLDQYQLMMMEQPLAHDDIIDHATLQKAIHTPICLDESITSFADARKAVQLGSCKIINIKLGRVGGITTAKKIHDYCHTHGIDVWCGGMLEAGIGRAHSIALSTLPGFTLPGDTAGSNHYWHEDIIEPEIVVHNGTITLQDHTGIGYQVNHNTIKKYRTQLETFPIHA